ncbi:MAG: hypothetical protein ACFFA4_02340 [Promethearchaeota archaeon]
MTLASDTNNTNDYNTEQFRKILRVLNQMVDYLGKFENFYDRKFNFSKLIKLLGIPQSQTDEIISLLLNFQEKFENVFKNYQIRKYRANNQVYLITDKKDEYEKIEIPPTIYISNSHIKLLNDIIYIFKHVNRGKGFDIVKNGSELLSKVKKLRNTHPYLFETKGNCVVYPSNLGLKLGEVIISYNKSNKQFQNITIDNHTFMVINDG